MERIYISGLSQSSCKTWLLPLTNFFCLSPLKSLAFLHCTLRLVLENTHLYLLRNSARPFADNTCPIHFLVILTDYLEHQFAKESVPVPQDLYLTVFGNYPVQHTANFLLILHVIHCLVLGAAFPTYEVCGILASLSPQSHYPGPIFWNLSQGFKFSVNKCHRNEGASFQSSCYDTYLIKSK